MKNFYLPALILLVLVAGFSLPALTFASHSTEHLIQELREQIQALAAQLQSLQVSTGIAPEPTKPAPRTPVLEIPSPTIPFPTPSIPTPGEPSTIPRPGEAVPIPSPSIFDENLSDDDIVQLNNLRIQNVSGKTLPAVISASHDFGVYCSRFQDLESRQGVTFPCPIPSSVLYHIKVDNETRLLLRNRQRGTLADFSVGDRINVYGFMDRDNQAIDAIVVRNLDKPQVQRFIQLNNVEVDSAPSEPKPPASFTVVQTKFNPCFDYGLGGEVRGVPISCPVGLEVEPSEITSVPPSERIRYPLYHRYLIEITAQTQIFQRDRTVMALSEISVGDILNIYGLQKSGDRTIEALIIRDLSKPRVRSGILRVVVTDGTVPCPRFMGVELHPSILCGIIYNATVELYDQSDALVGTKSTEKGTAIFENLLEGKYRVLASAPGYESRENSILVKAGEAADLMIVILPSTPPSTPITVISPNGGEVWQKGTTQVIQWRAPSSISAVDIHLFRGAPPGSRAPEFLYTIAQKVSNTGGFKWVVGSNIHNFEVPDGNYVIRIYHSGRADFDDSDAPFSITSKSGPGALNIFTFSLPPASLGAPYSADIQATGGTDSYIWNISGGILPPGLNFSPAICVTSPCQAPVTIAGNPNALGTYTFTVKLTSGKESVSREFTIVVSRTNAPIITSLSPSSGPVGTKVTIIGSNFTPTGNVVVFGPINIGGLTSADRKTLSFTVPRGGPSNCSTGGACTRDFFDLIFPGSYDVSVKTIYGTSNMLFFQAQ